MKIDIANRSLSDGLTLREDSPIADPRRPSRPIDAGEAEAPAARVLRDAAREAGLFQRSVLGFLDHKDWSSRVRADGQRLADRLRDMGFTAS